MYGRIPIKARRDSGVLVVDLDLDQRRDWLELETYAALLDAVE